MQETLEQLHENNTKFENIFTHLRNEHKAELLDWAFQHTGKRVDDEWQD